MYKLYKTSSNEQAVMRFNEDGSVTSFLFDPANSDYQAFLKHQAEGGKVQGADEEDPNGRPADEVTG